MTQIQRASDISRVDALKTKPKPKSEITPFVITYNPSLPNIACIINKQWNTVTYSIHHNAAGISLKISQR